MYLQQNNIYLPLKRGNYNIASMSELLSLRLGVECAQNGYEILLVLAYAAQYITSEELSFLFGSEMGGQYIKLCINRLCHKKLLRAERFSHYDGASSVAYCLTQHGIDTAVSLYPLELRQDVKVRRSGGIVPGHDYGVGMSVLSFLLLPQAFNFRREYELMGTRKTKRSLRIDALINTPDYIYYIEQDMGNENVAVLVNKISAYKEQGLAIPESNVLVFSCRRGGRSANQKCFSPIYIRELITYMEDYCLETLKELFNPGGELAAEGLSDKAVDCLESLLTVTGIRKSGSKALTDRDMNISELTRFYDELVAGNNLYRMQVKGQVQMECADATFFALARNLSCQLTEIGRSEISALLSGFKCYVLPTDLLSNYFPLEMRYGELRNSLIDLCPDLSENASETLTLSASNKAFRLTGCFSYNGGYVGCGLITRDLTFFIQSLYATRVAMLPYQVVGIVDTIKQAMKCYSYFPNAAYRMSYGGKLFKLEEKNGKLVKKYV